MDFRLAVMNDLPKLKAVFCKIIDKMNAEGIQIWDDVYPCEFFRDDIENSRLYVLTDDTEIAGAIVLCDESSGESHVEWEEKHAKALYIERFGVNADYVRKGIGSFMLKQVISLTKKKGINYLRLFVVDINKPAIMLYQKNGFRKAGGVYSQVIDDDLTLHEYGFEIKTY